MCQSKLKQLWLRIKCHPVPQVEGFDLEKREMKRDANPRKKRVDPERYGMKMCQNCHGVGKWTKEAKTIEVCQVCGGFGLVRMEDQPAPIPFSSGSVSEGSR